MDVFHPNTGEIRSDGPDGIACWFVDTDYNEESFFVRQAYFLFPASRRFQTVPSRVASACQPVMLVSASGERQRCRLSRFSRGVHR